MGVEADLQRALYLRLNGSIGASVYDLPPQVADGGDDSVFPYVTIGRIIFTEGDTQSANGFSALCRIHTHSRSMSMMECKNIQGSIYDRLHRNELSLTLFNNYSLLREDTDCMVEADGRIHGVCEYRALLERI